ncbi:Zinc finger, RING/FYVE/PHD-type [Artemisia annua]|uniref:Zinc finger, RING/FYVE/PHD-type n=1 Tax=Artemisia annua TaxID=35608 RepID=A0A2U1P417_ARTAN|nr:Zinc finger, RING/FYVE/PHD-type [Artemisia annua]
MRELCASVLSQVFMQSLLMIFIFHFGVVGGTLGAAGGAIFGFKNKMKILKYFIAGAVTGVVWSYRITWATFDNFLQCDHEDERGFFLHLIDIVAGESNILQDQDHIFLITKDFEVGDAAGVFPKCEHKYHPQCKSQWLTSHNSCPTNEIMLTRIECKRTVGLMIDPSSRKKRLRPNFFDDF